MQIQPLREQYLLIYVSNYTMMNNRFSIGLMLFISMIGFVSCIDQETESVNISIEDLNIEVETTTDVELIYSDSAVVNVIVKANTMLTNTKRGDKKQVFPDGVAVDFYSSSGRIQSQLTCKKATRFEKDKSILTQDSVVWRSGSGEILDSEELVWDETEQKVYSKRLVKITTAQDVIHGYGFEADQGFTKWKITRPQGEMGVEN